MEGRRVDVVVVNWNSGDDLRGILHDLAAQEGVDAHVLVVDNASADDSLARARAGGVPFELLQTGANLGYAGGNNAGFRHLGPAHPTLVANPDVRLPDPSTLVRLLDALDADPGLGLVTPVQRTATGQVEYLESIVDLARARAVHDRVHLPDVPPGTAPLLDLGWVDGAIFLARLEVLQATGGFDERYFLLQEEIDLSIRVRGEGWRLALCTDVEVVHHRGSSWDASDKATYYHWRNLYLLCRLHAPRRSLWRLRFGRDLARFVGGRQNRRTGRSVTALRGVGDALRRRYGAAPIDRPGVAPPAAAAR
jgi:N-acetylglucosaminyl-diphospho-decaprenol L-rhamnosyltransferase